MSLQLDRYLQARADGATVESACEQSGIGMGEAALHEKDIASGELELPRARAREDQSTKEANVARDSETTTFRINGGPEMPLDLNDIDNPKNDAAKAAIAESLGKSVSGASTATGRDLQLYIERAERLDQEIKDLNSDKSDLFTEMKSNGFDVPTIKRIIKLRKMEPHKRQEAEALLSTYMDAIGMTPIEAAIALAA